MMETQFSSPIYVVPQKMLQEQQQQSLLKLSSNPTLATAAPKYRVILSDVNKINKVLFNEKIQIAKSKPIATVVGSKRPAATLPPLSPISMKTDIKEEQEEDDEGAPMRKRANLDHLSPDERLQRRKLKNRVAAQNARDKKKAQTEEMEKVIEEMRIEKQMLAAENARLLALTEKLQHANISLSEENAEFKQRLGIPITSPAQPICIELPPSPASLPPLSPAPVSMSPSLVTSITVEPPESAAGAGPHSDSCHLAQPEARVVVQHGLDSLGAGLCDHSVLCACHLDDDIETVLSNSLLPSSSPALLTVPVIATTEPIKNHVAIEEEKLGGLEQSSSKILTGFHDLLDSGSEDPELDQILANNGMNSLEAKWNDQLDILFPELD